MGLTGQLNEPPTRFGSWDISTKRFIIELDEERHFNRYRFTTLNSSFYDSNHYFSLNDYKSYCIEKEDACLKTACWGKNWKNSSTEKQFLQSDKEGILINTGSSRWKQRAYYDFLKDVSSQIIKIPLLRISIYDTYKNQSVDKMLKTNQNDFIHELITLKVKDYMK